MKITKMIEKLIAIKVVEGDLAVRYVGYNEQIIDIEEAEVRKPKWKSDIIEHGPDKYVELY